MISGLIPFDHVVPIKVRFKPSCDVGEHLRQLLDAFWFRAKPKARPR